VEQDLDSRQLAADVARHVFRHQSGLLLGGVLHNLRSPLGGIVMLVSYLRETVSSERVTGSEEIPELLEEIREHLVNIEACAGSVEEIIGELSRYQQHTREVAGPQRDLNVVLRNIAAALRADLDIKHRVEVRLQLAEEALWMSVSPADVVQVVLWLTANARDAVLGRDDRILTISSGRDTAAGEVFFEVADSGGGIDGDASGLLTAPYASGRRGDPAAERRGVGSGLGGFLTDCVVEAMGGRLEVESGEGGTAVRVCLPAGGPVPALLDE
jgi:signal transduction histidine kinase